VTQRSYANDRYRKDAKLGSTRKSAAKAKPVRKAGEATLKREVTRASDKRKANAKGGVDKDWSGLPTSPEIKRWRRVWWVLLLSGLGILGITYLVPEWRTNEQVLRVVTLVVLACSMTAVGIDFFVIRKLRNDLIAKMAKKPSPKQAAHEAAALEASAAKKSGSKKSDNAEAAAKAKDAGRAEDAS
jgi:hypothetical protein